MLPNKSTIRKAIKAAERTLQYTQEGFKDYNDHEAVIYERIRALNHVLRTGKPYLPIIQKYKTQDGFKEEYDE